VPIDAQRLLARPFPEIRRAYDARDTIVHAIAIGLGRDAAGRGRRYVDASCLVAFPSMALSLGTPGFWMRDPSAGIDASRALHAGQSMTLHAPLPPAATIVARSRVTAVVDKGRATGALVVVRRDIVDEATGTRLATVDAMTLCRADGGCGSAGEPPGPSHRVPDRPPDAVREVPTLTESAALYALGGDDNPLHLDTAAARRAGYDRPILHGVCTLAIASTAVVEAMAGDEPSRLASLEARFTAAAYPGEPIRVELWRDGERTVAFRAWAAGRDERVLDAGRARIA
jgi:acyl dehydratase